MYTLRDLIIIRAILNKCNNKGRITLREIIEQLERLNYLAIGLAPSSSDIYSTLKLLEKRSLIRLEENNIHIIDREKLERLAREIEERLDMTVLKLYREILSFLNVKLINT